jgi:hypothetical protein
VACCIESRKQITNEDCLKLLDLAERWADHSELDGEVKRLRWIVGRWAKRIHPGAVSLRDWLVRWSVHCAANPKIIPPALGFLQLKAFRPLLREIMGDVFKPCTFDAKCRSTIVTDIARSVYESKDFAAMPVLADALEESGCSDSAILEHCRGDSRHYRGCWVVDLILNR